MNNDEIQSLVTKIIISLFSGLAAKYGIDGNLLATGAAAVGTLATIGFGVYSHWNMKKVPETATVTPAVTK